jgi:hypothetical protein
MADRRAIWMAGLDAASITLFSCWTVWLVVALWLVGEEVRWLLLAGFVIIAPVLGLTVGISWRGYLMAWLAVHLVVATVVVVSDEAVQALPAAVSLGGLLWLWIQDGAVGWQYVAGAAVCIACAALGFSACWMTEVRRVSRRSAAEADLARRSAARVRAAYEEQVGRRRAVETELAAQRNRYERQLDGYRSQLTSQRLELERARRQQATGIPHRRVARPGAPPRPVAGSAECTLVQVRCFTLPELPGSDPLAEPGSQPSAERLVRLAFERRILPAPADRFDEIAAAAAGLRPGQAGHDQADRPEVLSERLADATADYLGAKAGDPIVEKATERWVTRDSYPETSVADILTGASEWLHALIEHPLDEVAERVSVPSAGASLAAGVAAEVVLKPVAEPMTKLTEVCAIAGLVIGLTTGAHPLVVSNVKVLAHDAVNRAFGELIKQGFREIGIIDPVIDLDPEPPPIEPIDPSPEHVVDDGITHKPWWTFPGIGSI